MNKKELIDIVAEATGLPRSAAARLVEAVIDVITRQLASGGHVTLQGFGSFSVKRREARTGRNPMTGETITIAPHVVPSFRFSPMAMDFIDSSEDEESVLSPSYSLESDEDDAPPAAPEAMPDFDWGGLDALEESDPTFDVPADDDFGGFGTGGVGTGSGGGFGAGSGAGGGPVGAPPGAPSGAPVSAPATPALTENEIQVPVHYATNRRQDDTTNLDDYYGPERSATLTYGLLNVSIPRHDHEKGELERPGLFRLWRQKPGKHVMLRSISETSRDDFFSSLREHIAQLDKRMAFVFVHGFNCSFAAAARRAGQMAYDLFFQEENHQVAELSVAPILFSWPSEGSAVKYTHDISNAKSSIQLLQNFLREIVEYSGAEALTLIAHSMGCELLTAALEKIALAMQGEDGPLVQELILAAPDIDRNYFEQIADQVIRTTHRTTLYASEKDRALCLSREVNGYPRAGDSSNGVVIIEGIDSIDATKVGADILRHSYVGGATVLGDIFYIIRNGHAPDQRYGLRGQGAPPKRWWAFR